MAKTRTESESMRKRFRRGQLIDDAQTSPKGEQLTSSEKLAVAKNTIKQAHRRWYAKKKKDEWKPKDK